MIPPFRPAAVPYYDSKVHDRLALLGYTLSIVDGDGYLVCLADQSTSTWKPKLYPTAEAAMAAWKGKPEFNKDHDNILRDPEFINYLKEGVDGHAE